MVRSKSPSSGCTQHQRLSRCTILETTTNKKKKGPGISPQENKKENIINILRRTAMRIGKDRDTLMATLAAKEDF